MQRTVTRVYRGKRQADAVRLMAPDAERLGEQGYVVTAQSWADGRSGCMRFILLGGFGALIIKPDGSLAVTYTLQEPLPREQGGEVASGPSQPEPDGDGETGHADPVGGVAQE